MHEIHHEHLSSMIDGELTESHVPEFLDRIQSDSELQKKLDRYGLIRSAIRGEDMVPANHDLSQRVSALLEHEPTVLAPRTIQWKSYRLAGAAMAASIAALAVIMTSHNPVPEVQMPAATVAKIQAPPAMTNTSEKTIAALDPVQNPIHATNQQSPVEMASVTFQEQIDPNFDAYLLNHSQNASLMQMPGMLPDVRLVSYGDD